MDNYKIIYTVSLFVLSSPVVFLARYEIIDRGNADVNRFFRSNGISLLIRIPEFTIFHVGKSSIIKKFDN